MRGDVKRFGCLLFGLPAFALVLALVMLVAGLANLGPSAALRSAYDADPSCRAFPAPSPTPGGCRTLAAVATIVMPRGTTRMTAGNPAHFVARLTSGATLVVELSDGASADALIDRLAPGDPVQIQIYRDRPANVSAHDLVAPAIDNPDARAALARQMPVAGGVLLLAIVCVGLWLWRRSRLRDGSWGS